jgi:hypothetical protein
MAYLMGVYITGYMYLNPSCARFIVEVMNLIHIQYRSSFYEVAGGQVLRDIKGYIRIL